MKKIKMVLITMFIALALIGCGAEKEKGLKKEKGLNEVIPNLEKIFIDGELNVMDDPDGEHYNVYVKPYTRDQWIEFVNQAKEMGYTNIMWDNSWEGEELFGATYVSDDENNGKYWLYTDINHDQEFVNIEVAIAASYKKAHPEEFEDN